MEKELKELTEQLNARMATFEKANQDIKALLEGKVDAAKLDALDKVAEKAAADIIKLNEEFEKMQQKRIEFEAKTASFEDAFMKSVEKSLKIQGKDQVQKALIGMREKGSSASFSIDFNPIHLLKDAGNMTAATNLTYGTFANSVVEPFRTPGVAKSPDREVALLDMMSIGQLAPNQPRLTWIERSARTEGAAARLENNKMAQSDFTYISRSTDVQNISTFVKTTTESLEYWDQLLSEIRMELVPMLQRKLDGYLLTGNATPPQLDGITNHTYAYTYTGLNEFVAEPTVADAVFAALTQVKVALYRPTGILMHPTDVAKMWLTKDKSNNSARNVVVDLEGTLRVGGVPVRENTGIAAGKVLVGDFTKTSVWFRKGIEIRLWDQNEDDPVYNRKTITADMAAALKFPTVNYDAFVYDNIEDILEAITKVN